MNENLKNAQDLCDEVVDREGEGGPEDHVLVARAVKNVIVALQELGEAAHMTADQSGKMLNVLNDLVEVVSSTQDVVLRNQQDIAEIRDWINKRTLPGDIKPLSS